MSDLKALCKTDILCRCMRTLGLHSDFQPKAPRSLGGPRVESEGMGSRACGTAAYSDHAQNQLLALGFAERAVLRQRARSEGGSRGDSPSGAGKHHASSQYVGSDVSGK